MKKNIHIETVISGNEHSTTRSACSAAVTATQTTRSSATTKLRVAIKTTGKP